MTSIKSCFLIDFSAPVCLPPSTVESFLRNHLPHENFSFANARKAPKRRKGLLNQSLWIRDILGFVLYIIWCFTADADEALSLICSLYGDASTLESNSLRMSTTACCVSSLSSPESLLNLTLATLHNVFVSHQSLSQHHARNPSNRSLCNRRKIILKLPLFGAKNQASHNNKIILITIFIFVYLKQLRGK